MEKFETWETWEDVKSVADLLAADDNFVYAFIDGIGIGVKALNADDWAICMIGSYSFTNIKLTSELYEDIKNQYKK